MHLGYKNSTPRNIQKAFNTLASNDIKGPTLVTPISDSIEIVPRTPMLSASQRLKDYDCSLFPSEYKEPFDGLETTFDEDPLLMDQMVWEV